MGGDYLVSEVWTKDGCPKSADLYLAVESSLCTSLSCRSALGNSVKVSCESSADNLDTSGLAAYFAYTNCEDCACDPQAVTGIKAGECVSNGGISYSIDCDTGIYKTCTSDDCSGTCSEVDGGTPNTCVSANGTGASFILRCSASNAVPALLLVLFAVLAMMF